MPKAIQRRRGTTAEHSTFTGLVAELTVDTTKKTVVVHDGATAGGVPLMRADVLPVPTGDRLLYWNNAAQQWQAITWNNNLVIASGQLRALELHGIALSDEVSPLGTGTGVANFSLPYAFNILSVYATLNTVSTSGLPTVNILNAGTTIFSTKLTIDANELTSGTAATPAVLSTTLIPANNLLSFNIDVAGTGAKGLKVFIQGYQ